MKKDLIPSLTSVGNMAIMLVLMTWEKQNDRSIVKRRQSNPVPVGHSRIAFTHCLDSGNRDVHRIRGKGALMLTVNQRDIIAGFITDDQLEFGSSVAEWIYVYEYNRKLIEEEEVKRYDQRGNQEKNSLHQGTN